MISDMINLWPGWLARSPPHPGSLHMQESQHTASSHLTAPGSQLLNAWRLAPLAWASSSRLPSHAGIAAYGLISPHGTRLPAP